MHGGNRSPFSETETVVKTDVQLWSMKRYQKRILPVATEEQEARSNDENPSKGNWFRIKNIFLSSFMLSSIL